MLRDLYIKNLAVVAEASLCFGEGFNILTGETGAGKSIVVDALALLAGGRASNELIRAGNDTLVVTGAFEPGALEDGDAWRGILEDAGIEAPDDALVIRREVSVSGRNRVFVNDQPATLRLVQMLAPSMLRIHGQREELGLVAPDLQRAWLDRCGGANATRLTDAVAKAYSVWSVLAARLARQTGEDRTRHERIDLLRFQLQELESAAIEADEEHELRRERSRLRNAETIGTAIESAITRLFDGDAAAFEQLAAAGRELGAIEQWDADAGEWSAELEELRIRAGELAETLRQRRDGIEVDPRRLDGVEDRLATLERLMRKHGTDTAGLVARRRELADELAELEGDEIGEEALRAEIDQALADYREKALRLSEARRKWADALARRTRKELADLALAKARFEVRLERRADAASGLEIDDEEREGRKVAMSVHGIDSVVYTFSPNPGEDPKPLTKAASGGELSRLYLAVQLAVRSASGKRAADSATLVFDEVDTGIGGAEAAALGAKLKRLASGGQILAVTHLPQVASQGDLHFKVKKAVRRGRTHTDIEALDGESRTEEVARMLAGSEITDLSLSHARELIASSPKARRASGSAA